jgi:signal transduction histidine kinase/DNA-binding response OmpR family regulator
LEDKSGILWIGAYIGLNKFNKERKQFTRYYSSQTNHNKLSSNIILSITEDNSGYLWFATGYGLNKYEKGKNLFTSYVHDPNNPKSLSDNSVRSIYEDKKGTLWICTQGGGLNKFNRESGEFIHFRKKDGLPSDIAFDILEDEHNNLWISTSNGLTKFNSSKGLFRNYDTKDGLPSNEFSYRAKFKGSDGIIYFGTKKGLVAFHPDSIKDNPHIPPIVVTNFLLFNKSVPIGLDTTSDRMILEKSIINTKELELTYEDYIFSFEFAALDFHAPEKNKYAYMMEGFEKSWTYTDSKKRFATYTNLDPGEYTFRVIGSNNDGVWNEEGASIKLIITPPWWKTWWAYTFYILLGLSLLYSLRRYELNRTRYKHGLELKEVEAEKLRETDRMKSHFFANISHEFRTPLTLILGPADNIKSNSSTEDIQKQTGLIKRNANRLLNLVNQLLDLSKLEAGKLKVHASKGNIVSFVKGVAMSFESIAEKMDIQLRIKSSGDEVEMYFDKEMMIKILSNLLSNSFKFTHESGEITVNIKTTENDSLEIKIRDTGIGIASEELPKLFDRFYQVDASHTRKYEGTGIGLALTKELVELHHGSIKVESKKEEDEQNGWTEFIIELPLGKEHFAEDELVEEVISDSNLLPESKEYNPLDHSELEQSLSNLIHPEAFQLAPDEERMIILLVEDNSDVRDFIKDSLGNEFVVEEAFNGEHGVKKAENIIPDLIISDIMMPKMDGNELTRILKNDEKTSHIPIILLTAKSEQESKLEGLETGADDYLTKPFDTKELMIRIKNLINVRRKLQERYSRGDFIPAKKEPGKKLSYLDEQFMNKVMEVIEKHLSEEEFSIEQFGKEAGMSRVQLHRKLKALSGKSASTFLRSVRLSKAKKMIEEQKGNISEIAYSVGFSSPQYFTRCFKKEFGYPPSEVTI